ncbi:FliH/SctL family protein [Thermanaeromonas toyohensis]|nr:FliH/SctL family protein [Thermanaeromonas toyohensis]
MEQRPVPVRPVPLEQPEVELLLEKAEENVKERAELLLEEARREAESLREKAQKEVEALKRQGWEEGYRAGWEEGHRDGLQAAKAEAEILRREGEKIREQAREVLKEAKEVYKETLKEAEEQVLELALEIAEQIVGRQVELNRDIVLDIAHKAIQRVAEGQFYTIYASPDEAALLRQHREELLKEAPPKARLQIIADPALKPGGCRVETESGFVDATVDTQLMEVRRLLKGA